MLAEWRLRVRQERTRFFLIVIQIRDDLDLPFSSLRVKQSGSSGGRIQYPLVVGQVDYSYGKVVSARNKLGSLQE